LIGFRGRLASLELPRSALKRHPVTANVIYDAVGIRMTKLPKTRGSVEC
jgi:hypothetical protein